MRKVLFFIIAVILIGCSKTNEEKARDMIVAYLEEHANDPKSVEIISIQPLEADSASRLEGTVFYAYYKEELERLKKSAEDNKDEDILYKMYLEEIERIQKDIEESRKNFVPFFKWKTVVAYRGKNAIGALVRTTANVKFDKELTKIESFDPVEE